MRTSILAAAFALVTGAIGASAQPATEAQREAFDILVDRAVREFTIFFNCRALDERGAEGIAKLWRTMVTDTIPVLRGAGYPAADIIDFVDRTDDRRMMLNERPFGEVIAFCRANNEQMRRMLMAFEVIRLPQEAQAIFAEEGPAPRPR